MERQFVGVCMPPIWSCKCAQGIRQATQASSFCFETDRFENNYLPGRHPHYVPVARPSSDSCSDSTEPIRGSGICDKLRKVQFRPMPCDRVSRVRDKLTNPNYPAPKGQNQKCQEEMSKPDTQSNPSVRKLSKFLVLLTSSIQAIFAAPLHYRNLQFAKNQALRETQSYEAVVHLNYQAIREIHWWRDHLIAWNGRAILRQPIQLTIETDASTKDWGAHCQGVRTGRGWSPEEKELHINCLEHLDGSLAIKNICKRSGTDTYSSPYGQCFSSDLHQQVRGNPLFCTEQPISRVVDIVFNQSCQANCLAYPRYNQYSGRSEVTSFSGLQRLETKSTNLSSLQQYLGPLRDTPVCQPSDQATSQICELETRSRSSEHRSIYPRLEPMEGVCFPPIFIDRTLPQASSGSTGCGTSTGRSSFAATALVPSTPGIVCRQSSSISSGNTPPDEGPGDTPIRPSPISWVVSIRRSFEAAQISPEVRKILLSAWCPNATRSYESAWSK